VVKVMRVMNHSDDGECCDEGLLEWGGGTCSSSRSSCSNSFLLMILRQHTHKLITCTHKLTCTYRLITRTHKLTCTHKHTRTHKLTLHKLTLHARRALRTSYQLVKRPSEETEKKLKLLPGSSFCHLTCRA